MKLLISDRGEMEECVAFAGKIPTRNACLSYKNGRLCSHDMQSSLLPTFFFKHNIRTSDAVLQQRRSSGDPGPPRPPPGAQAEAGGKRQPVLRVRRMHGAWRQHQVSVRARELQFQPPHLLRRHAGYPHRTDNRQR
jgi:hypothetical protein